MSDKSIAIIGAGIAGLSAGCYAQMNGYRTQIFEMHTLPGGLCTAWTRKGYTFDGCIHHLVGAGAGSPMHQVWQELGALREHKVVFHDTLVRIEMPDGRGVTIYTDPERLRQHLKELSPADARLIDEYAEAARRFAGVDLLTMPLYGSWEMLLRTLPSFGLLRKWGSVTVRQFAARFSDPFLRRALPTVQYDAPDLPMMVHLSFLAGCHRRILGWSSGGSLKFAQAIARRYLDLGGELHYQSRVAKILVENDRAVGVRLADGTEASADRVISAADGHATIFEMLDGRYADDRIRAYYDASPEVQPMTLHVSLGVARDMSHEPQALVYFLDEPVTVAGKTLDRLDVEIFNFDPTLAPTDKCVVKVLFESGYGYWKDLSADRARYEDEKRRLVETVIARLDRRFPGLREQVEVSDVATPLTVERYTGNWHGLQAWPAPGAGFMTMIRGGGDTLPGLDRFHMVGQWAGTSVGLSTVAARARKLIRQICRRDGQKFATTVA